MIVGLNTGVVLGTGVGVTIMGLLTSLSYSKGLEN